MTLMKNSRNGLMLIAAIALSTLFTNCKGDNSDQHNHGNMGDMSNEEMSEGQEMQQELSPLMRAYMDIKEALVEDNAKAAMEASEDMMNRDGMSEAMKGSLQEIAGTENLDQQRSHFSDLSEDIYKMAKNGNLENQPMYWKHCPMAKDNEGANWLSMHEEVSNPYMGQKMLQCGSVKETL